VQYPVTVIFQADSYSALVNNISSVQAATAFVAPIIALTEEALLNDLELSDWSLESVSLVRKGSAFSDCRAHIDTPFVLVLPVCNVQVLGGISLALELLERDSELQQVGGFVVDSELNVHSGAYCESPIRVPGAMSLIPVEATTPLWRARGSFASTSTTLLGGLVLMRTESLNPGHLHPGSLPGRALAGQLVNDGRDAILFSGLFAAATGKGKETLFTFDGTEDLGPEVYRDWDRINRKQATVMHQGFAVKNDVRESVVLVHDRRTVAADGLRSGKPFDSCQYYLSDLNSSQLGPGFQNWLGIFQKASSQPRRVLTEFEESFVRTARLVVTRFSPRARRFLKRALGRVL